MCVNQESLKHAEAVSGLSRAHQMVKDIHVAQQWKPRVARGYPFFWQFRVQTVATAVNGTVGVDTTPACTRAYAHYSRAHFTRDD